VAQSHNSLYYLLDFPRLRSYGHPPELLHISCAHPAHGTGNRSQSCSTIQYRSDLLVRIVVQFPRFGFSSYLMCVPEPLRESTRPIWYLLLLDSRGPLILLRGFPKATTIVRITPPILTTAVLGSWTSPPMAEYSVSYSQILPPQTQLLSSVLF